MNYHDTKVLDIATLKKRTFSDGSNVFEEAKMVIHMMKNSMFKRNPHLRKAAIESS